MKCEQKDYSWEEVAEAVDGIFSDKVNPEYGLNFPNKSFVKDICNNVLSSAMRRILEWCFIHDQMNDQRLEVIKNGYTQLEDKGWIGKGE
jgi:hypothetical protein